MNNSPLVSILVPVYNVESFIERCARSLFEQTYDNLKYIFVDDCSTDESKAVLERVISEYPHREPHVQVFSFPENKGLATARNFLVDQCQTDWLVHVDADDWVEHDLVAHLVEKQQETGADIVISNYFRHNDESVIKYSFDEYDKKSEYLKLILSDMGAHNIWGRLIRHSLYVNHSIRVNTDCVIAEDYRAFIRLSYYANLIAVSDEYDYHYNSIQRRGRISVKNRENIHEKGFGRLDTLLDVKSFVAEKIPEYLDLYETNISKYCYEEYIYLSLQYGNRDLHKVMIKKHKELVSKYPFLYSGFRDNIKRYLKYNYSFYYHIMRLNSSLRGGLMDRVKRSAKSHYWFAYSLNPLYSDKRL